MLRCGNSGFSCPSLTECSQRAGTGVCQHLLLTVYSLSMLDYRLGTAELKGHGGPDRLERLPFQRGCFAGALYTLGRRVATAALCCVCRQFAVDERCCAYIRRSGQLPQLTRVCICKQSQGVTRSFHVLSRPSEAFGLPASCPAQHHDVMTACPNHRVYASTIYLIWPAYTQV